MIARNFRTEKGTELPLLNLRGKQYLEVKYRLVWFREDHPMWSIETELPFVTDKSAYAKATIRDETHRVIATSHKFESTDGFPDFIEKAETGAIGRALALIGYGTQFCADELEDPKLRSNAAPTVQDYQSAKPDLSLAPQAPLRDEASASASLVDTQPTKVAAADPLEFTINFGRKYKGMKLKQIERSELDSYMKWLESSAVRDGTTLSYQVGMLKNAIARL